MTREFSSESQLADAFHEVIAGYLVDHSIRWVPEVHVGHGIPDALLVKESDGEIAYVVAVEFKLRKWQRALAQSFRYARFANEAYVVLDEAHVKPALAQLHKFRRSGIGLATLNPDGALRIYEYALPRRPFSRRTARALASTISGDSLTRASDRFQRSVFGRAYFARLPTLAIALGAT